MAYNPQEFQIEADPKIKESYLTLIEAIDKSDDEYKLDDMKDAVEYMNRAAVYVAQVYRNEIEMPTIMFRYRDDKIPEKIQELDTRRRNAHEAWINGVRLLNKMCDYYHVPHIYHSDLDDRWKIANLGEQTMHTFFATRDQVRPLKQEELTQDDFSLDERS